MKKLFWAAIALLVTGCSSDDNKSFQSEEKFAPVSVRVSDFSMAVEDFAGGMTRSESSVVDYTGVDAITLAFYDGSNNVFFKKTQTRSDNTTYTTFGEFSCNLPVGSYTMVAIAQGFHDGDVFTLSSPTEAAYTGNYARETFTKTQNVEVTSTNALSLDVTLNRVISKLSVVSTDGRPANATKVRTTYSKGSKSFNPSTGLATNDNGFSVINNPSSAAGATISIGSFLFLHEDEETMNVTLDVMDASENVLMTKVINNVPFKRNRVTKLTGAVFTPSASSASFKVEAAWISDYESNF